LLAGRLLAHDSPEHTVEELTARISREGPSALLLFERASEWRVLGRFEPASADLRDALRLDPNFVPARVELCKLQLAQGRIQEGLVFSARSLLSETLTPRERAQFQFLRARLLEQTGALDQALAACQEALAEPEPPVDWPLFRSQLQGRLGRHEERIAQLQQAWQQSGSFVLRTEYIEALIDDRRWDQALAAIEPELGKSRWQSSWLIRRGRVRLGQGNSEAGRADLRQAIEEITERFNPARPDLTLLADRARAYQLLGETTLAEQDLARAHATPP
jgi:tetratricopeptide (TPR) repeat protein